MDNIVLKGCLIVPQKFFKGQFRKLLWYRKCGKFSGRYDSLGKRLALSQWKLKKGFREN